jgi:hypothetical protein
MQRDPFSGDKRQGRGPPHGLPSTQKWSCIAGEFGGKTANNRPEIF